MADTFRPNEGDRRRSFDRRDRSRERDPRDREYRDRNRDQDDYSRRSSDSRGDFARTMDRDRDRNRDYRPIDSNRETLRSNRAPTKRSNSAHSSPSHRSLDQGRSPQRRTKEIEDWKLISNHKASIYSSMSALEGNPSGQTINQYAKRATDILCKKLHWHSQREDVAKQQKKLQEDIKRFDPRRFEFASLHSTHERQLESLSHHSKTCAQHLETADQEFLPALVSLLYSICDARGNSSPPPSSGPQEKLQEFKIKGTATNLDSRPTMPQKGLDDSLKSQISLEVIKVKEEVKNHYDSKIRALEEALEKERSERKQEDQRHDLLKTRLDALTQRMNLDKAEAAQKSDALEQSITATLDELSQKIDGKEEAIQKSNQLLAKFQTNLDEVSQTVTKNQDEAQQKTHELDARTQARQNELRQLVKNNMGETIEKFDELYAELNTRTNSSLLQAVANCHVKVDDLASQIPRIESELSKLQDDNTGAFELYEKQDSTISSLHDTISSLQLQLDDTSMTVKALQEETSQLRIKAEEAQQKLQGIERTMHSNKVHCERTSTESSREDIEQLRSEIRTHSEALKSQKETQALTIRDVSSMRSRLKGLPIDQKQVPSDTAKVKGNSEGSISSARSSPVFDNLAQLVTRSQLDEYQRKLDHSVKERLMNGSEVLAVVAQQLVDENKRLVIQFDELTARVSTMEQTAINNQTKHNRWLSDFDSRLQQQINGTTAQQSTVTSIKSDLESTRQEVRAGHEDLQMQLHGFNNIMANLNSKPMFDHMAKQVYATISAGIPALVDRLAARVDILEMQNEEPSLKKRKTPNGGAVVVNGNH